MVLALAVLGTVAGSLLVAAGPRFPVAHTRAGLVVGPAFGIWPLLAVLSVAPAVAAVMLLLVRQWAPALAMTASLGALAVGRALLELQLVRDPARAARAELAAPTGLGVLHPGPGAWLLLVGELMLAAGGIAAAVEVGSARGERSQDEPASPPTTLLVGVGCAVLAGVGLLASPYGSDSPYLVPRSVLDAPGWAAAGGFALAVALGLAVALACSSPDSRVAAGGLVGAALAVLGVAAPRVVEAAAAPSLRVAAGPVLALVGASGLAVLATWVGEHGRRVALAVAEGRPAGGAAAARVEPLPAGPSADVLAVRCRRVAAVLGAAAGAGSLGAALLSPLHLAAELPRPQLPTLWLPLAVGIVLVPLAVATLSGASGAVARPTLAVALVALPMALGEPVGELLSVVGLRGVGAGPGLWLMLLAVVLAAAAGLAAVLAGGFERDDVDLSRPRPGGAPMAAASAAGAVLTVPAFWLPMVNGAGRGTTGVLQPPFGVASWALVAAFMVTLGALVIAPRCRPIRAAALLAGVAVVLALRLVRLVAAGLPGLVPGEGTWATALCLVVVGVALALAMRQVHRAAPTADGDPGEAAGDTRPDQPAERVRAG